jgi:predicted MFS family arabinose efflux permease
VEEAAVSPRLALLVIAVVAAAATWLALRVVPPSDQNALPSRFRRRITWWRLHVRWVYTCCAAVAAGASLTHLPG